MGRPDPDRPGLRQRLLAAWLRREAGTVIGVEPDPALLALAAARDRRAQVRPGSAEHIPLADASADVVHARFAYFWPPGCAAGLAEVRRVLRPGGTLVVVDNDQRAGDFAGLLRAAAYTALGQADATDAWWAARGAVRTEVMSRWEFGVQERFRGGAAPGVPRRGGLLAGGPPGRPRAQLRVRAVRRDQGWCHRPFGINEFFVGRDRGCAVL